MRKRTQKRGNRSTQTENLKLFLETGNGPKKSGNREFTSFSENRKRKIFDFIEVRLNEKQVIKYDYQLAKFAIMFSRFGTGFLPRNQIL